MWLVLNAKQSLSGLHSDVVEGAVLICECCETVLIHSKRLPQTSVTVTGLDSPSILPFLCRVALRCGWSWDARQSLSGSR